MGLALELAAGTILAEVLAVLVALAEGDGVAFAVELALAEGLALADALGEAEVAGGAAGGAVGLVEQRLPEVEQGGLADQFLGLLAGLARDRHVEDVVALGLDLGAGVTRGVHPGQDDRLGLVQVGG